jgi:hypothetical protein
MEMVEEVEAEDKALCTDVHDPSAKQCEITELWSDRPDPMNPSMNNKWKDYIVGTTPRGCVSSYGQRLLRRFYKGRSQGKVIAFIGKNSLNRDLVRDQFNQLLKEIKLVLARACPFDR